MKTTNFSLFSQTCIDRLRHSGRIAAANLYSSSVRSFSEFLGHDDIMFSDITPEVLKLYERHLIGSSHARNTVSSYMRMLRAIYNKGVTAGLTVYVYNLFHDVFTGIDRNHKKALDESKLRKVLTGEVRSPALKRIQAIAVAMYGLCGMPFVDLQHLDRNCIVDGVLKYNRSKTGAGVNIPLTGDIRRIIDEITICNFDLSTDEGYRHYQSSLRKFNAGLKRLAKAVGVNVNISSYTFRHSWATNALHHHVPIEVISSALGHSDIRTTQIYLKGFDAEEIGKANRKVCRCLKMA